MNNKIKYITIFGGNTHAHHPNCNDCNMPKYAMSLKYAKDIELVKSPFADYTDIEFTNLMLATGCGVNGNDYMDTGCGNDITMIGENKYIVEAQEDDEDSDYAFDKNGKHIVHTLEELKVWTLYPRYENVKVFPCVKKVTRS